MSRFDPTGEIDLENPVAVETATKSILDRLYGESYDSALLKQGSTSWSRSIEAAIPAFFVATLSIMTCAMRSRPA